MRKCSSLGKTTSLPDEISDNSMCIACKTYPIYHRRVIWKVTRCFIGNRTVTPPAFGEQLIKQAQNLCLPVAHHKIKGLRAKEPSLPDMLQSPCTGVREQTQMQLFLPQPLQWQELTNLWSWGRMLCLQPADICKLLLQRCAWFQALGITAYGFSFFFSFWWKRSDIVRSHFFLLCFCQFCATFKRLYCGCAPPIHLADATT